VRAVVCCIQSEIEANRNLLGGGREANRNLLGEELLWSSLFHMI